MNFLLLLTIAVATYSSNSFASFLCSKSDISNYQRGLHIEDNLKEFGFDRNKVVKIDKNAIKLSSKKPSKQSTNANNLKKRLQVLSNQAIKNTSSKSIEFPEEIEFTEEREETNDHTRLDILKQESWLTHIINNEAQNIVLPICSIMDGKVFMSKLLPVTPSGPNYVLPTILYEIDTPAEWQQYFLYKVSELAHLCITKDFQVNYNTVKHFLITFHKITQDVNNTRRKEEEDQKLSQENHNNNNNNNINSAAEEKVNLSRLDDEESLIFSAAEKDMLEDMVEDMVEDIKEIDTLLQKKKCPAFKEIVLTTYFKKTLGTQYTTELLEAFKSNITSVDIKEDQQSKRPANVPLLPGAKKTTTKDKIIRFLNTAGAVLGGGAVCVGGCLFSLKAFFHLLAIFDKYIGLFPQK